MPTKVRQDSFTLEGLTEGAYVWAAYGAVECWAATVLPKILLPWRPGSQEGNISLSVIVLVVYTVFGGLLGAVLGTVLGSVDRRRLLVEPAGAENVLRTGATIALIGISALMLLSLPAIGISVLMLLGLDVLLICVWMLGLREKPLPRSIHWMANPWSTSALLTGLAFLSLGYPQPRSVRAFAALLFVGLVAGLTLGVSRLLRRAASAPHMPMRRAVLVSVTVGAAILLTVGLELSQRPAFPRPPAAAARNTDAPNIVMITLDTVRADHLSVYGYERRTSPNLSAFAQEATRYASSVASGNYTLPTHASAFTGLYPSQHGAHNTLDSVVGAPLDPRFATLAELLSANGYRTIAISANTGYVNSDFGMDQGFEYFDSTAGTTVWAFCPATFLLRCSARAALKRILAPNRPDFLYRSSEQINREVFSALDQLRSDDDPFFLFINYMDAHIPYLPPAPFDTLFPGKDPTFSWASADLNALGQAHLNRDLEAKELNHLISQYDGAIAYLDSQLGELFDRLRRDRLMDKTLVVIWADHGESFGEHGVYGHGGSLYQGEVGVPILIRYPGQTTGRVVEPPVSTVDLFPTILEVADVEIPGEIAGESLVVIRLSGSRPVFSESFPSHDGAAQSEPSGRITRAVVSGTYKLIWPGSDQRQLYDLIADPSETANLYASRAEAAEGLEALLTDWLGTIEVAHPTSPQLDDAALRRLRALGYIR